VSAALQQGLLGTCCLSYHGKSGNGRFSNLGHLKPAALIIRVTHCAPAVSILRTIKYLLLIKLELTGICYLFSRDYWETTVSVIRVIRHPPASVTWITVQLLTPCAHDTIIPAVTKSGSTVTSSSSSKTKVIQELLLLY
jgi:hypothetical protein